MRRAGRGLQGEGTHPALWRYCTWRPRPAHLLSLHTARYLAERITSPPPKVIGRDTPKDAPARSYTSAMADEVTVLEEAMDNLKEAGHGMTDGEDYRDLLTRLSTALAMTEVPKWFHCPRQRSAVRGSNHIRVRHPEADKRSPGRARSAARAALLGQEGGKEPSARQDTGHGLQNRYRKVTV